MQFKIIYQFLGDEKSYTCYVTFEQYKNFKALPVIGSCEIIMESQEDYVWYKKEMGIALKSELTNNTTHILKLSQMVDKQTFHYNVDW